MNEAQIAEIAELRKSFVWVPVERLSWYREQRPSRLLGPAVSWAVTFDRGVCPICGVRLQECWGIQNAKPLGVGSHGYTHVTYPALFNLPERLRHRLMNPQKALQMTEPERTAIMVTE